MPIVDIDILSKSHKIQCDEGQEKKLLELAYKTNLQLKKLSTAYPHASDINILIMHCLILEDKIDDLMNAKSANDSATQYQSTEEAISKTLEAITEYVDNLANKLEKL